MKNYIKYLIVGLLAFISILSSQRTYAHCEIPCGIYEDSLRIKLIKEHIKTMHKSMNAIEKLSKESNPNYNQIVRWVNNKEEHAEKLQEVVSQYFLHQRLKPVFPKNKKAYKKYTKGLELLHRLLFYSMKSKQTIDVQYIDELNKTIMEFEKLYFHKH